MLHNSNDTKFCAHGTDSLRLDVSQDKLKNGPLVLQARGQMISS